MMTKQANKNEAAEAKLPGARLIALRVWSVVGAIIIGVAILNVMGVLAPVIEFLAVGSLIAFIESPIVNALEHKGVPRSVGALIGLVAVVAVILCVLMVIGPVFAEQIMEVLSRLPQQLRGLGDWAIQVSRDFEALSQSSWASQFDEALRSIADVASTYITQLASGLGAGIFPFISSFTSQLFIVFLGIVLAYWLALDYPRIHREIGIIVGGVAVVALIVAAVLFLGGSPTADAPSDEPAAKEDVDSDVKVDGIGEGLTGVGKGDGDTGSDVAAATDLGGTVFDLSRYEGTPSEVEDFLQSSGLELSDSWASDGGGFGDAYANVSFAGPYGGATPIEGTGEELMVTVEVSLGSTAVTWDEDGYAEDLVSSLDELASDAEVTGVTIDFDSPVAPSDFPSAARAIYTAMDLPVGSYVSASNDELLSSALAEFGISDDNGDVTDYIGDVLFVDGASFAFRGRDAYCQVSLMGGEEFGNTTMVTVDINS